LSIGFDGGLNYFGRRKAAAMNPMAALMP